MNSMNDEMEELKAMLDQSLTVKDERGREVIQIALLTTLYLDDPFSRAKREAIASCCDDYFMRCGQHLRWALNPDTRRMEVFGKGSGSTPSAWLPDLGEEKSFSIIALGAQHPWGASSFYLNTFCGERRPYEKLGFFRVAFPLLWFADQASSFPEVVLEMCRKLQPSSGYGGIGIMDSPDVSLSGHYQPIVYELAQRFPGIEADFPIEHGIWLTQGREGDRGGIKGVNWLTVVADRWLAELGGADKVEADVRALDDRFIVHRYGAGLMIQAGERPQLGDSERDRWPELNVKLSRYFGPIRITRHCPFGQTGAGPRFTKEEAIKWLRRFDGR